MTVTPKIKYLSADFAIAADVRPEDFDRIASAGFRTVINNRPDGEELGAMTSEQAREAARKAGLYYRHVPAASHALFDDELLHDFQQSLDGLPGPVIAFCKTGTRSAVLWARLAARHQPVASVLRRLAAAGYELSYLEPELEQDACALLSPPFAGLERSGCPA